MTWQPRFAFRAGGEPLPKERPRATKTGRSFTPKRTREAEGRVLAAFRAAYPNAEPLTGRLLVEARFYRATRRGVDADNLAKLAMDALNGVAFVDDEQIEKFIVERHYGAGDRARTEVRIYEKDSPA
ncbi:RusA family crossover junction endodeoxyribonuclease [Leucobacter chironomi]|uniref:RusA family crossover junction endodeoxyribonuclease n=1 Tax=Leucobacter chironomi TaxID=491918 RepID=UPI0004049768|nr:RusA family crossover junction endodeoxyribonuclease [Leucobacter chironomi]